jgi:hypothetical protein
MPTRWLCAGLALLCVGGPGLAASAKNDALKTYRVPFRLTGTNHVLVRARIDGKGPYNFILDTGAPALFVAEAVGKKLGVKADKDGWGTFDRFEIEGGAVETKIKGRIDTPFQLKGMNALRLAGVRLHGIIGFNVLARYRITFDFTKDKMLWARLDFDPGLPRGLSGKVQAPGGLETLGKVLEFLGMFVGKVPPAKTVRRGFIGIELAASDGKEEGVLIKAVLPDSPAAQGGLRAGDLITRFQGGEISDLDDVRALAAKVRPGQKARFHVVRKGKTQKITVTAGEGL